MLSAHLQCFEVTVDDDVVEAGANSAVAQLLALCTLSCESHFSREGGSYSRALQNTGTLTNGWPLPSAIVLPTARPWLPAT